MADYTTQRVGGWIVTYRDGIVVGRAIDSIVAPPAPDVEAHKFDFLQTSINIVLIKTLSKLVSQGIIDPQKDFDAKAQELYASIIAV